MTSKLKKLEEKFKKAEKLALGKIKKELKIAEDAIDRALEISEETGILFMQI